MTSAFTRNLFFFFFFNDTATTEIYTSIDTLSLHDALPISNPVVVGTLLQRALTTHGNPTTSAAAWQAASESGNWVEGTDTPHASARAITRPLSNACSRVSAGAQPTVMPTSVHAARSASHRMQERSVSGRTTLTPWRAAQARSSANAATVSPVTRNWPLQWRDQAPSGQRRSLATSTSYPAGPSERTHARAWLVWPSSTSTRARREAASPGTRALPRSGARREVSVGIGQGVDRGALFGR